MKRQYEIQLFLVAIIILTMTCQLFGYEVSRYTNGAACYYNYGNGYYYEAPHKTGSGVQFTFPTPIISLTFSAYAGSPINHPNNLSMIIEYSNDTFTRLFCDGSDYIDKGSWYEYHMQHILFTASPGSTITNVIAFSTHFDTTAWVHGKIENYILCDEATDTDNDQLSNLQEYYHSTDYFNPDTDGDGFLDGEEVLNGWDPLDENDPFIDILPPLVEITTGWEYLGYYHGTIHIPPLQTYTVTGNAYDNLQVNTIIWSNDIGESGVCSGTSSWSFDYTPTESSPHWIYFYIDAYDQYGNKSVEQGKFILCVFVGSHFYIPEPPHWFTPLEPIENTDIDGDGWDNDIEIAEGTNPFDSNDYPVDIYATPAVLSPTKDSYIQSANPAFCYGGVDNEITVSGCDHMSGYQDMYMYFDFPADMLGNVVNKAVLQLYVFANNNSSALETIYATKVLNAWDEGPTDPDYLSFATAPQIDGLIYGQSDFSGTGWLSIDITDLVNDWLINGNNAGLKLFMDQITTDNRKRCYSKESSNSDYYPRLLINEPDITLHLQSDANGKDSYIQSANPVFCYGGVDNEITVSGCDHMGGYQELLVQFNLPTLPSGKIVQYASMDLYLFANNNADTEETIYAHKITEAWDEGPNDPLYVSYNTMPASEIIPLSSTTVTGQGKWITLDITDAAIDWMELGEANHGILLKMDHIITDNRKRFSASEASDTTLRPKLNIFYGNE